EKLAQQNGRAGLELTDDASAALRDYDFPGNVRELENILERATTLCEGTTVTLEDLHLPAAGKTVGAAATPMPGEMPLDTFMDKIEKDVLLKALEQTRYNKTAAAKQLGITFRALRYRLKKLGLE
ncbi:MAG: helix-turn-helix domain-containing protein, partial [Gammaproteobacteria bacterium]